MKINWFNLHKEITSSGKYLVVFLEDYKVPYLVVHFDGRKMFGCYDLKLFSVPKKKIVSCESVSRIVPRGYFTKKIKELKKQGYNIKEYDPVV